MSATTANIRDALERAKREYEQETVGKQRKVDSLPGDKVLRATHNIHLHLNSYKLVSKLLKVPPPPAHCDCTNTNVVYVKLPRCVCESQESQVLPHVHSGLGRAGPPEEMPEPNIVENLWKQYALSGPGRKRAKYS